MAPSTLVDGLPCPLNQQQKTAKPTTLCAPPRTGPRLCHFQSKPTLSTAVSVPHCARAPHRIAPLPFVTRFFFFPRCVARTTIGTCSPSTLCPLARYLLLLPRPPPPPLLTSSPPAASDTRCPVRYPRSFPTRPPTASASGAVASPYRSTAVPQYRSPHLSADTAAPRSSTLTCSIYLAYPDLSCTDRGCAYG